MRAAAAPRLAAGAALFAASFLLFRPGWATFDTVAQYAQAVSGRYDDWHPPVMARVWALLGTRHGAAPLLAAQLAGWWGGLALLAARVPGRAGWWVMSVGALPPLLAWQGAVLKDAQLAAALVGAVGLVGWWRLAGRRVPWPAVAGAALLLGYAGLVRANGVFAAAPLAAMLLPVRGWAQRTGVAVALTVLVLAVSPLVNHRLLGASATGVERTEALYDLAGIAVRAGPAGTGLTPAAAAALAAKGCVRPFFWDPLGEPARCDGDVERLRHVPPGRLYLTLGLAALRHPLAYAGHRLAHLNSTERWLVPAGWPDALPPAGSEPNDLGLGSPGAGAGRWLRLAGWAAATPLGWPVAWVVAAAAGLGWAGRRRGPVPDLARAALASALALEASFAALSIASDLRYHLWPMTATALGLALLAGGRPPPRRVLVVGGAALALVVAAGLAARAVLPAPWTSYEGMLG